MRQVCCWRPESVMWILTRATENLYFIIITECVRRLVMLDIMKTLICVMNVDLDVRSVQRRRLVRLVRRDGYQMLRHKNVYVTSTCTKDFVYSGLKKKHFSAPYDPLSHPFAPGEYKCFTKNHCTRRRMPYSNSCRSHG